jgi:hypothetical protein
MLNTVLQFVREGHRQAQFTCTSSPVEIDEVIKRPVVSSETIPDVLRCIVAKQWRRVRDVDAPICDPIFIFQDLPCFIIEEAKQSAVGKSGLRYSTTRWANAVR